MRFALPFCLALAACSVDPLPLPDGGPDTGSGRVCSPGAQVACACVGGAAGAQVCRNDGSGYGACDCPDAGGVVDAGSDSGADAGVIDSGPRDSGQTDAGASDVGVDAPADVPGDTGCPGSQVVCNPGIGRCVNLQTGWRRDDGSIGDCGACGVTCGSGMVCFRGVCGL